MTARIGSGFIAAICLVVAACSDVPPPPKATTESPATAPPTKRVVGPLSQADADALTTMNDKLKEYVALHKKIENSLPALPKEATPKQIDDNQREFGKRIQQARAAAKPGEVFTAQAQPVIKRLLDTVFGGPDGKQLKASIMDENPLDGAAAAKLTVNARYPDAVPLTTVPPEVLQTLPQLTEALEYRFVGDNLILLDGHAHVIVDFIPDAMPK
jgi:hypothetical protein